MRAFYSFVCVPLATLILIGSIVGACAQPERQFWEAQSDDGRVNFTLLEKTARVAFQRFCENEADLPCDDFEAYKIEVHVAEDLISMNFTHDDVATTPHNVSRAFGCGYLNDQFECHSG